MSRVGSKRRPLEVPWGVVFCGLIVASLIGFAVAPWSLESKSTAVLHGLCSQRPSHSFWFGMERLPFDARMTGIYGGFLTTQLSLLAWRRLRAVGIPSLSMIAVLGLFILSLVVDGFNSTIDDLGLPTLYGPSNALRFVTGALTGTTLAVFIWLLLAMTLWRGETTSCRPAVRGWLELAYLVGTALAFGLIAGSGLTCLYMPAVLCLLLAAILALFELALAGVQLSRGRECSVSHLRALAGPATAALLIAYGCLLAIGGSRFLLESWLQLPQMH